VLAAWLSQLQPAWSTRYLAVLLNPLRRSPRCYPRARAGRRRAHEDGAIWLITAARRRRATSTPSHRVAPEIRAGDLVVSTARAGARAVRLPRGAAYLAPLRLTSTRA
jgi:hypothetical protein